MSSRGALEPRRCYHRGPSGDKTHPTVPAALKALDGYLKNRVLVLPAGGPFVLGRSLEADLTLYGADVEDRHVALVPEGPGHRIVPVSSRGTTRVRGEALKVARALRDGDAIALGPHVFAYVAGAVGAAAAGTSCAICAAPVRPDAPDALLLARGAICPRCLDRRLHANRQLERFRVLRKFAGNEEEIAYLALDKDSHDRVALRLLKANREADPRRVRRFLARAMVGLVLDHPNYLPVRSIEAQGGICFAVLDHHAGLKLERLARERSPIPPEAALAVANQLAEVLRHGRERRLIVAKRKRTGVIVDRRLWVKVMSFDLTLDLEAAAAGTAAFAELAERCGFDPARLAAVPLEAQSESEARLLRLAAEPAEAFSVGRILFQLLTGKPFVTPASMQEVRNALGRLNRRPAKPVGLDALPPELVRLLDRIVVPPGPDRLKTLDAVIAESRALAEALGTPAMLEAGELDIEIDDDDDDDL